MKKIEHTSIPGVTDYLDNLFDVSQYKTTKMRIRTVAYGIKTVEVWED